MKKSKCTHNMLTISKVKNSIILLLVSLLFSLAFFLPTQADAKTVTWSETVQHPQVFFWAGYNPDKVFTIENKIRYTATITNLTKGGTVSDGNTVEVGDRLQVNISPLQSSDVTWSPGGEGVGDTDQLYKKNIPRNGYVSNSFNPPSGMCIANNVSVLHKPYCTGPVSWYGYGDNGITGYPVGSDTACPGVGATLTTINVAPPTTSVSTTGSTAGLSCSNNICTVTSAGTISIQANFSATDLGIFIPSASAENISACTHPQDWPVSPKMYSVPSQSVSFSLTGVVPANQPPSPPTISGPTSGQVSSSNTFTFTGTDPDGDQIRYGIDWDRNGTVDQWLPGGGYINTGVSQNTNRIWGSSGTYTFQARTQDSRSANSTWSQHTITVSPAPSPTANLTINGSNGPLTVNKNSTLNLAWTSSNASSCSLYGAGLSGGGVPLSGSRSVGASSSGNYVLSCSGATDTVSVTVQNRAPSAPTITGPTSAEAGQTNTFSFRATDPDNDQIYYEIDWDNNGTVDVATPGYSYVNSGTTMQGNRSWSSAGSYAFQVRTVDYDNARSGWSRHNITINNSVPPTAILEASINGGSYQSINQTINPGDSVTLRWSSTNATTCTGSGSGFNSGGATSGSDAVSTPTPNTSTTFTISCSGSGGNGSDTITITTRQKPNFTQPSITASASGSFNPTTGIYDSATITFSTNNGGGSATQVNADYQVQFDRGSNGYDETQSGTLGTLGVSQSVTRSHSFSNIPFGDSQVRVTVDSDNDVDETNENDNVRTLDLDTYLPPPDPGLSITASKNPVRPGERVTLTWTSETSYPMNCEVRGPAVNVTPSGLNGSTQSGAINAKSTYTFSCVEPTTGTTFEDSVTVETVGTVEEI